MGIFDQLKNKAQTAAQTAINNLGNQREKFTFTALPESVEQLQALPEAAMDTPYKTAALTVCALCAFAASPDIGTQMLNFSKHLQPTTQDWTDSKGPKTGSSTTKGPWPDSRTRSPKISLHWV